MSASDRLRLAFMGAPDFALPSLAALQEAGHEIVAVYSQPARPAGRKQALRDTPVGQAAKAAGIPLRTPTSLKDPGEQAAFAALQLHAAIVVAYGLLLPQAILDAPRLGCFNVHASLLPRWRGAAPIQRAIQAGDRESGVAIMQMEAGLDTGPVLASARQPIGPKTTGQGLHDALASQGAALLVGTLAAVARGEIEPQPQPVEGVTYAAKLQRSESALDWSKPAVVLERQVRAFTPWPGSHFLFSDERVKVLEAVLTEGKGEPGTVLDAQLTVACGEGALRLSRLQRPGRGPQPADALRRGFPIPAGSRLS
ncbi:MAG: methionyl-tRNA formyltransferase [Pseudomonadota bacterium]